MKKKKNERFRVLSTKYFFFIIRTNIQAAFPPGTVLKIEKSL